MEKIVKFQNELVERYFRKEKIFLIKPTFEFFMYLRVVITGKKISPPLNESMEILGKKECLERLAVIARSEQSN